MAQVRRDGAQWVTEEYDVTGSIDVPALAAWDSEQRAYVWHQPHHVIDDRCPACASCGVCAQRVEVFPDASHVLVVHEAPDVSSMN